MGTGDWFKNIICLKKNSARKSKSKHFNKKGTFLTNGATKKNAKFRHLTEDIAAAKIQSAFRSYKARKALRRLKGVDRFRGVIGEGHFLVQNQATSALNHIHFWSRIQSEIRARWLAMVVDSRSKQKKLENQIKLEAKLHELEVEWSCGPETMEEIVNRIQQREAAAAKRERTLAYAFSHQALEGEYESIFWAVILRSEQRKLGVELEGAVGCCSTMGETVSNEVKTKNNTSESTNLATTKTAVSATPALSNGKVSNHATKSSKV